MSLPFLFHRLSLKARLILSYLVILGVGGLATSTVGSWMVSSAISNQVRKSVDRDLASASVVYGDQLERLRQAVQLTASSIDSKPDILSADQSALLEDMEAVRQKIGFDFLDVTDRRGHVICRAAQPKRVGDDVSSLAIIRAALSGKVVASSESFSAEALEREDPQLRERAYLPLVVTAHARPTSAVAETSGLVQVAAAPLHSADGRVLGVLYGGVLLNRSNDIVDRVWDTLYKDERFRGRDIGTMSIFLGDVRVSTKLTAKDGARALATRAAADVYDTVVEHGATWRERAWVADDWYITSYQPIRNYEGRIIGMLAVGVLERAYTYLRDQLILTFFGLATLGFIFIIGITYYIIRSITQPIAKMVAATQSISAGRFDQEVETYSQDEIGMLAASFNRMLGSLRQMRADLEEWGRTLEQKVQQRTQELMVMQRHVAESERLASLGMLAAGVAHEINNPLGGILALTALTLEDIPPGHPYRENLEEVIRQAERSRDIVKGLLQFSRQSHANAEMADINAILDETLSFIAKQSLFFNIQVVRDLDSYLPPVIADKSQLQQVFFNILMNAVQAMEEKGTLTIATRDRFAEDTVEILISDTGEGIPSEQIHRIFDPFFTTKGKGGTGLGLAIAYGIIAEHGGDISVQSEVGKGTQFTIRLPVARVRKKAQA